MGQPFDERVVADVRVCLRFLGKREAVLLGEFVFDRRSSHSLYLGRTGELRAVTTFSFTANLIKDAGMQFDYHSLIGEASNSATTPSAMRPFRNSLACVGVRPQTTRLRYSSAKRGPTSFRRYRPSESATFGKIG